MSFAMGQSLLGLLQNRYIRQFTRTRLSRLRLADRETRPDPLFETSTGDNLAGCIGYGYACTTLGAPEERLRDTSPLALR